MKRLHLFAVLALALALAAPGWAANKTVTVKPSGGTYTTLAAAIAGELVANADLVTMAGILNIEIDGTWSSADTAAVLVDGFTTSAAYYVNIYTTAACRHAGVYSTSKYRIEPGTGEYYAIQSQDDYVRITGIQAKCNPQYGAGRSISIYGPSNNTIDTCIVSVGALQYAGSVGIGAYGAGTTARNCVIYACPGNGITIDAGGAVEIDNCTIGGNGTYGIARDAGTATVKNTYSGGNGTSDYNGTITFTTCASSDATVRAGVTASVAYSVSAGAYLTNITGGTEDFHIGASSALKNVGTDLSGSFTTDIDGQTRPTGANTWDIGADEIPAAAAPSMIGSPVIIWLPGPVRRH
jgi:hypothetical protein